MDIDWKTYEKASTKELLEVISLNDDPELDGDCTGAFHIIIERFRKDLLKKCEIICFKREFEKGFAVELANDTFKRYWKYPKFDFEKYSEDELDKKFLHYLYQIANNLIIDIYKKNNGIGISIYTGEEEIIREFPEIEEGKVETRKVLKEKIALIDKALMRLGPKHKIIYLTYQQYEEKEHKLPRKLLKELREELKLSQDTIRYYKREANQLVQTILEVYGK